MRQVSRCKVRNIRFLVLDGADRKVAVSHGNKNIPNDFWNTYCEKWQIWVKTVEFLPHYYFPGMVSFYGPSKRFMLIQSTRMSMRC